MKRVNWEGKVALFQAFLDHLSWGDRALMLLVLVACLGFIPWLNGGLPGQAAVIRINNEVVATLSLKRERQLSLQGPLGETVVQVKAGKIRVVSDPGPRQLCVLQGWISRAGQALVCLPNRVLIQIPGQPHYDSLVR